MTVFAVFEHPDRSPDRTIFVKEGFSPLALIFTVFWALWHRMWIVSAILIVLYGSIYVLSQTLNISELNISLVELLISVVFGFEARNLWGLSLRRAGYREEALVMASTREEAEIKYAHARRQARRRAFTAPRLRAEASDTLGLFGTP